MGSLAWGNALGGDPLRPPSGAVAGGGAALLVIGLAACGAPSRYRDYALPALFAPGAPEGAGPGQPVPLAESDSELFEGGIRLVRPERAVPAPAFALRDESGKLHTPESLRGRVVWIDLWAEWCGTCRAEFPGIQHLHERYGANGLTVLAVCRNSKRAAFEQAVSKDWLSFPVVDASSLGSFPIPYRGFPTSLLLDRGGRVRGYWSGHRPLEAVEKALRHLLAESPGSGALRLGGVAPPLVPVPETGHTLSSAAVLTARLELPRDSTPRGELFEGKLVLDIDPGWHVSAGPAGARGDRARRDVEGGTREASPREGSRAGGVGFTLRLEAGPGISGFEALRPRPARLPLAGGVREVYSGRVEFPVWGLVRPEAPAGRPVEVRVAAVVQACDIFRCLAPAEILLSGEIWVAD